MFKSTLLQGFQNAVHVGKQQIGSAYELDVERGVEHVRRGHALMHKAAVRTDEFGQMGQKCNDVMLRDGLDLVDTGDVELRHATLFPDGLRRFLRDDAELRQRLAGIGFDLEPDAELRFGRPDGDHFRPGIARDHGCIL